VYLTHGSDPLAFVIMGPRFTEGDPTGALGYDGQFAYYIAKDPIGALPYLDNPAYRYQRILYPLLARVLSLGQPALVPWMLLIINVISISMSTELLGRMISRDGISQFMALLLPFWFGQVFALRANLNEPLCYLLVLVALWCFERGQYLLSAAALAASVLTKEGGFLFLPAVVLVMVMRKRWWLALRYVLIATLPYTALQISLRAWLGRTGLANLGARFEVIPFHGFTFTQPLAARIYVVLVFAVPVSVLLALTVYHLLRARRSVYAWSLLVNCLFIVFLSRRTAMDVLAVFRVSTGTVVSALLFCGAHRVRRVALALHAIWLPHFVLAIIIPGFLL
jgi:hypothetical protein